MKRILIFVCLVAVAAAVGYPLIKRADSSQTDLIAAQLPIAEPAPGETLRIDQWALSPKGDRAALSVTGESAGPDDRHYLYLVDLSAAKTRVIIDNAQFPAFSPDGKNIAFSLEQDDVVWNTVKAQNIVIYDWKNDKAKQVRSRCVDRQADWREGSEEIAFASLDFSQADKSDLSSRLMVMPTGNAPQAVGPEFLAVDLPLWRPGANEIAFIGSVRTNNAVGLPRATDLYIVQVETGECRQLTFSGEIRRYPLDWSPDGKRLVYAVGPGKLKAVGVVDADSGDQKVILRPDDIGSGSEWVVTNTRWSPQGDAIALETRTAGVDPPANVALITWPDLRLIKLTQDDRSRAPRWSADGEKLFFVKDNTQIWTMNRDGTNAAKLYPLSDPSAP